MKGKAVVFLVLSIVLFSVSLWVSANPSYAADLYDCDCPKTGAKACGRLGTCKNATDNCGQETCVWGLPTGCGLFLLAFQYVEPQSLPSDIRLVLREGRLSKEGNVLTTLSSGYIDVRLEQGEATNTVDVFFKDSELIADPFIYKGFDTGQNVIKLGPLGENKQIATIDINTGEMDSTAPISGTATNNIGAFPHRINSFVGTFEDTEAVMWIKADPLVATGYNISWLVLTATSTVLAGAYLFFRRPNLSYAKQGRENLS